MKTSPAILAMFTVILWTSTLTAAAADGSKIASTFSVDEESWTHTGASVFQQEDTGGNPGGMLLVDNSEGPVTYIFAPAAFLGDLARFDGGEVSFEGNMLGIGGSPWVDPRDYGHLRLKGPTLSAEVDLVPTQPQHGQWVRYSAPLDAGTWGLSAADWAKLLANVTEIRLSVEAMFGSEVQGIDNFTLATQPQLELSIDPRVLSAGDTVIFEVAPGKPSALVLTFAVMIDGVPSFLRIALGRFDPSGRWTMSSIVPPGLSGLDVTFLSIGVDVCARLRATNQVTVAFL